VRLRTRLMLLTAVAAVGPIAVLGIAATRVSAELMTDTVTDSQGRSADELASHVDMWLTLELHGLAKQVRAFRVDQLRDSDLVSLQRLIYQQSASANIVSIISPTGQDLAPSLYLTRPDDGRLATKEAVTPARFSAFRAALPLKRLAENQDDQTSLVVGKPYVPPKRAGPVIPVIVPADSARGLFMAFEVALDTVDARFTATAKTGMEVALLDGTGKPFIHRGGTAIEPERFRAFIGGASCSDVRYRDAEGRGIVAACADVPGTGWLAVVAEPVSSITSAGADIRLRTLYIAGFAGLISILLGAAFSRPLAQQVSGLKDAAFEVAEGRLGLRVSPAGPSEVRELALAFNFMSSRLARNRAEIDRQREAIDVFNLELQRQLDEQRVELTEAHRRLVQSARLAAVGEMGAGLAHELNNPLAGILGMVQVLRAKEPASGGMLEDVEEQAQRCRQIVQQLLRFSRGGDDGYTVDRGEWSVVDLGAVVQEVITLVAGSFRESGVEVVLESSPSLQVRCDREAMGTAFAQLLTSLRAACGQGGGVRIDGAVSGAEVGLRFTASGPNLDLSKDDWKAMGMGFWFARQVISDHDGQLEEPTETDSHQTATWTVVLPGA
jgi:two-component system NtrC family sensor kinase